MGFDWSAHKGGSGDNWTFDSVGTRLVGTVRGIRTHLFPDKSEPTPILAVESDEGVTKDLICGLVNLRRQVADFDVQVGDRIAVTYTGEEKLPGRPQAMKVFEVVVKKSETPAPSSGVSAADLL
jgi:hypothetical protein